MWKQFGKPFYVTLALLLITTFFVYRAPRGQSIPLRQDLNNFPEQIGAWRGEVSRVMDPNVLEILRVDHYLDRLYRNESGLWISLYIGYFEDQKDGETVHSPRNCMPGSGWNFLETTPMTLQAAGPKPLTIHALRAVLVNGEQRMLTYYWYQSRGRFETSEYWQKINLVADAMRYNRTDGALVRVLAPLPPKGEYADIDALMREFIIQFMPTLYYEYFPEPVAAAL